MKKLFYKFLCFIGYHHWEWSLLDANEAGYSLDKIPPFAKCSRCGQLFR